MPRPRPRRALRPTTAVRVARLAVPLALVGLGTTGVVAFALPGSDARTGTYARAGSDPRTAVPAPATTVAAPLVREQPVSRDLERTASPVPTPTATSAAPTPKPAAPKRVEPRSKPSKPSPDDLAADPKVSGSMWSTDELNIRTDPDTDSDVVTVVRLGTKLSVTGTTRGGFRLVVYRDKGRWVTTRYLSRTKPKPAATGGVSNGPCAKGSGMESGLTPDAVLVHRTLCVRYPQITSFGGLRGGGGFHATGQAVDCMIGDSTVGWQVAHWVRAHARELGVSEVIYSQHIWTVQRGGEGWRSMSDRGSRTANHYDHVHVSVYGHRAA